MLNLFYTLDDDNNPVAAETLGEVLAWREACDTRVTVATYHGHGHYVSTVFLGINHNFRSLQRPEDAEVDHRPFLFETLTDNGVQARYHTWAEAERGHEEIVEAIDSLMR